MTTQDWPELGFEDLIGRTRFDVHERAHIVVDGAVCTDCSTRDCVVACPAKLFVPTSDGGILFNYEQCFECGTCYLVCNREGAISWSYPEGGHGVVFPPIVITVCWKWVAAGDDERWAGVSESDRAAVEVALVLAESSGDEVTVVSVGRAGADTGLREALAVGAARIVRIDAPADLDSAAVARAIAAAAVGADWVVCGDASSDRGTGSVPAFVAAELGAAQALGLVGVTPGDGRVRATRRLDGGRREVLDVRPPAVLSVEGAAARLRRAALTAELRARTATVDVVPGPAGPVEHPDVVQRYRPRARAIAAPEGAALTRVLQLTDAAGSTATTHELVTLEPAAAADRVLEALAEWGYHTQSDAHARSDVHAQSGTDALR